MSIFKLPAWVSPHLYTGKTFNELSEQEFYALKAMLSNFNSADPEISIVVPAWNEERYIHRTLSSLAANNTSKKVEIIVVNNNSTDNTQQVLDRLEVKNFFQLEQGPSHARQMGLEKAKGKFHLCADSDTLYPPKWIDSMVKPMEQDSDIVGVYGRYSFIPGKNQSRWSFFLYETLTSILIKIRKPRLEFINVLGFNMGFVTETGRITGGFKVKKARIFDNALGSEYFVDEAEDGTMALNLLTKGRLKQLSDNNTRAFTSSRRLQAEGGIFRSLRHRLKLHGTNVIRYISSDLKSSKAK